MSMSAEDFHVDDELLAQINAALDKNRRWMRTLPRDEFEDTGILGVSVVFHFAHIFGRMVYVKTASGSYAVDETAEDVLGDVLRQSLIV